MGTPSLTMKAAVVLVLAVVLCQALTANAGSGMLSKWANIVEEKAYRESLTRRTTLENLRGMELAGDDHPVITRFYDQTLDHFNAEEKRTYKQRYHINSEFWTPAGPVFIYVGGESELSERFLKVGHMVELAKKHGALMVGLEHRYYGYSTPDLDQALGNENIRFLSSQQALADLANFVGTAKATNLFEKEFLTPGPDVVDGAARKWISVGGSYPGSLSAWVRTKFPHLVVGSIASSAPVRAKLEFFEYDQVVGKMAGDACRHSIQEHTKEIEAKLSGEGAGEFMKSIGECNPNTDPTAFLYVMADQIAFTVQYSNNIDASQPTYKMLDNMCHNMTTMNSFDAFHSLFDFFRAAVGQTCDFANMYNAVTDQKVAPENNNRSWYYQSCTEFGYFQVAPKEDSVRSAKIDLAWHQDLCKKAFGENVGMRIDFSNAYYGADKPAQSNIVFPNGSVDPWHALSVTAPIEGSPLILPIMIEGTSHCTDLKGTSKDDPAALTAARVRIDAEVARWLAPAACPANCNQAGGNGLCLDGACYCANGFSGEDCARKV